MLSSFPLFPATSMSPVTAFAVVGLLGIGAQWLAWRLRLPGIVLMLTIGLLVGPVLGLFVPGRDIGPLVAPMVSMAVAVILFEGGLTLNLRSLHGAAGSAVRRLVFVGAPLGWLFSALALHYVAGLGWASSAVFGGLMIVTGPTVIAPLLRGARLRRQPAAILQWEAIVNDPVGALAAVLGLEVVMVLQESATRGKALGDLAEGILLAALVGVAAGAVVSWAFSRAKLPEYMKVPALFVIVLGVFAFADFELHESGLLTVTIMGVWLANAGLPSFAEIRRFKEQATLLLVSGVFILLAASMRLETLLRIGWRELLFIAVVILLVRPLTVLLAFVFSAVPWRDRILVALTGPRGVVMIAVAGLFGERLVSAGIADAAMIGPLSFVLVTITVVVHGFLLRPLAKALDLVTSETPGVLIIGGTPWSVALAGHIAALGLPVLVADISRSHLRAAREAEIPTYFGDILAETAEFNVNLVAFSQAIAATDNDAYNTLVCTAFGHHYGREFVFQPARELAENERTQLPSTLGGRILNGRLTSRELSQMIALGWAFRTTSITEEFSFADWKGTNAEAIPMLYRGNGNGLQVVPDGRAPMVPAGAQLIALYPPSMQGAG